MILVYFIQAGTGGPIKIGQAGDAWKRLRYLQSGHYEALALLATIPARDTLEAFLHRRFRRGRIRGEWFRPDTRGLPELIASAQRGTIPDYALRHVQIVDSPVEALLSSDGAAWVRHGELRV